MILEKFQSIYFGKLSGTETFLLMTDDECVVLQKTDKINKYNIIEILSNKNKMNENIKLIGIETKDKIQPAVIHEMTLKQTFEVVHIKEEKHEDGNPV